MPSITPNTAERTAAMPTSAIVGPRLVLDLVHDGLVARVRAAEVERAPSASRRPRTAPPASRRGRTRCVSSARCVRVRFRPRNRFATGSVSTTRNRKKLKTTTKSSVASDPSTLPRDEASGHSRSSALAPARSRPPAQRRSADDGDRDDRDDPAAAAAVVVAAASAPPTRSTGLRRRVGRRGVGEQHRAGLRRLLRPALEAVLAVGLRVGLL